VDGHRCTDEHRVDVRIETLELADHFGSELSVREIEIDDRDVGKWTHGKRCLDVRRHVDRGGATRATTPAGKISLAQLSQKLYRIPWNVHNVSHFLEIDVSGLGAELVAPNIYLVPGDAALSISGRIIRSGKTLP
jgi:hypothetical protein